MKSLCIIPVFNQADQLPPLLEKCRQAPQCDQFLIVDDGSDDGSEGIIRKSGFPYLSFKRHGIGHSLIQGTHYARHHGYDTVIHMAGNGKMLPQEMGRLLRPIRQGLAEYVWGSRYLQGGNLSHTPWFRKYGIKYGFNLLPKVFCGKTVSDATCGFRAYQVRILDECAPHWDATWLYGYEFEYYVLAHVLKSRFRFLEVPISMIYPEDGKNYSKIIPVISWWSMLKPWLLVGTGMDRLPRYQSLSSPAAMEQMKFS